MAQHIIEPIAHIRTNLTGKFGLPRQAGVVPELTGVITFEPDYRCADALRGLEGFSHIWLLWGFSENDTEELHGFYGDAPYAATVRPPRLGGNLRRGDVVTRAAPTVFAMLLPVIYAAVSRSVSTDPYFWAEPLSFSRAFLSRPATAAHLVSPSAASPARISPSEDETGISFSLYPQT